MSQTATRHRSIDTTVVVAVPIRFLYQPIYEILQGSDAAIT